MAKYRFEQIAINSTEKKKPVEEDRFTYLGLEHLDTGSLKVTRFGSDVAPIGEKLIMHKGDVLFGKRRAYQKKVAIAPFDGIFSAHGMVLRPKEDVVDKDFFQFYRNLTKTTQIYNPSSLFWNYFQTETAVFATSMFSNAVVFTSKEAEIASVTIDAGQKASKGKETPIKYTIATVGTDGCFYNKCTWSISGATSSRTKINPAGILEIGKDETSGTISVTATSVQDPTKTSTVNVTVTA